MIELTGFGDLLRGIGLLYWLVALAFLYAALTRPGSRNGKLIAVLIVVLVLGGIPGRIVIKDALELRARKARLELAMAHFAERCKGAGEFVHRTVDDVEGLFVGERPMPRYDYASQNAPGIYFDEYHGDEYLRSFLAGRNVSGWAAIGGHINAINPVRDEQGRLVPEVIARPGYRWVEAVDPKDGRRYRFTAEFELLSGSDTSVDLNIKRHPPGDSPPRYGIRLIDISTPEDRALWVTGGLLQVVDLMTNEILAERIGFMIDPGQGSTATARSPWQAARSHTCPPRKAMVLGHPKITGHGFSQIRLFVEQVLKIKGDRS